ncbi:hypothetical protein PS15p_204481 [Mucor circinelloides]
MSTNYQYSPQPCVVLPSIQSMLNGVRAKPRCQQYHYTPQLHAQPVSVYQLTPLEPSLDYMHNRASNRPGHTRHYSDVTPSSRTRHHHPYQHEHKRALSEHTFDYARKKTKQCFIPHSYYDQQDSEDSSSGCSTPPPPPPQQQPYVRLKGQTLDKYECLYCDKKFSRPSSLRTHIYSHTGEKPYLCNYQGCNRTFSVRSNMRRHMKTHKPFIHKTK